MLSNDFRQAKPLQHCFLVEKLSKPGPAGSWPSNDNRSPSTFSGFRSLQVELLIFNLYPQGTAESQAWHGLSTSLQLPLESRLTYLNVRWPDAP